MKQFPRISATVIGIFIGGIAYWFQPYNQTTVLGVNIWMIMGVGAFLGALLLMIFLQEKPSRTALLVTLGVIIAIFARILFDTLFWDPTSHNLAPFELILAGCVTAPGAFIGVYLGVLFNKYFK